MNQDINLCQLCAVCCFACKLLYMYGFTGTVSCGGNITLTVPKCALQGLTLLQLQFIDSSCDVSNYATDKGDSYEFRIVFNECGATIVSRKTFSII